MNSSHKATAGSIVCIIIAVSVIVLSSPNPLFPQPLPPTVIPFEVIDPGNGYNYESRDNITITDQTVWENLWLTLYSGHHPIPDVPVVNFTSEMLIAVFQGVRGSSGYYTNITRILSDGSHFTVYIDEIHPGENCSVLTVMTYPYQIVKISHDSLDLPVFYIYNITYSDCG